MASSELPIPDLPAGSLILITGATGHIACHTTKILLARGFRVRGTVRDLPSASWLTDDLFAAAAAGGLFELAHVPDMSLPGAFNDALRGVSAVAHVASIMAWSPDPREVIPPVVAGVTSILESAARQIEEAEREEGSGKVTSVRAFVYTSSIAAATDVHPDGIPPGGTVVGRATWNEEAVRKAWDDAPSPEGLHAGDHWHTVYMASKVEAEKALWRFVEERKPAFRVNVVSPSTVLGEPLVKRHLELPYPWIKKLNDGEDEIGKLFPALIHVDVQDVALLHIAAMLDQDCSGARLQAWAHHCNMNSILAVLRKLSPHPDKIRGDYPGQTKLNVTADFEQSLALLKKWTGGQDGWRSLEESVEAEFRAILKWMPDQNLGQLKDGDH